MNLSHSRCAINDSATCDTVAVELVPPRKLKQIQTSLKAWAWEAVNSSLNLLREARTKAQES